LGSNEEKFELLKQAERLFFPAATANPPSDPDLYKADIESRKPAFDASLAAFQALQTRNDSRLVDFLSAVEAELPKIKDHDLNNFDPQREKDDLEPEQSAATRLRLDVAAQVTALRTELQRRIDAFAAFLVQAQEGDLNTRLGVLFEAAKLVLGEDFHLMPRFSLPAAQAAELTNAWNARSSVLAYARTTLNKRFPMDEWLYGVARVRSKLAHWESASVLVEAFNPQLAFDLTPLQLPYKPGDTWLGLEFPADYSIDNDKLLLTTHFAAPFDASTPQCGILIDEWTEVIPAKQEITGLTFHFDRPNTEPPQVCLLAISPQITGSWQWSDLVDTLSETLAMAKARAIEPDMIDNTGYGHFLPATVAAVTLHMITISANYGYC
jgi:hypothetical protein